MGCEGCWLLVVAVVAAEEAVLRCPLSCSRLPWCMGLGCGIGCWVRRCPCSVLLALLRLHLLLLSLMPRLHLLLALLLRASLLRASLLRAALLEASLLRPALLRQPPCWSACAAAEATQRPATRAKNPIGRNIESPPETGECADGNRHAGSTICRHRLAIPVEVPDEEPVSNRSMDLSPWRDCFLGEPAGHLLGDYSSPRARGRGNSCPGTKAKTNAPRIVKAAEDRA